MDRYNVNPHPIPESSYSQDRQESVLFPTATTKSCPRRFGHSVQALNVPYYEYLNHHKTNQVTPVPQHTLNDHSVVNLPPIETLMIFTESASQKDLDEIVPVDGLTSCTDSTKTNWQQTTRQASSKHSPVTFSHSLLCPVTTTTPRVQPTQQQVHAEIPGYQLTESLNSANGRAYRTEMATSGNKGMARQAGRDFGRATGKAASKAQRERSKKSATDNQFLAISSREARTKAYTRAYGRAYNKAYKEACRAEMSLSGNKDKAHEVGRAAGRAASKNERERIRTLTDFNFGKCLPIPNFCDNVQTLFTIPLEPISP